MKIEYPSFNRVIKPFFFFCLIAVLAPFGNNWAQTTITTSGTWVCPTGVTSVQVECWGGGGAGAGTQNSSNLYPGGGGGGGNYSTKTISVTPGNSYTVTIGAGGTGGVVSSTAAYGGNGGTTSFGGVLFASGGSGGGGGQVSNKVGLGGINGGVRAYTLTVAGSGYTVAPTITVGTAWSSNQAYTLNQQFYNAGKLYTVTTAGNSGTTAPTHSSGAVACSGGSGPFATLTYAGVQATASAPLTGSAVQYVSVGTSSTVTTNAGMGSGYIATPTVTVGTSWSSNQAYVLNQQYFNAGKLYTVTTAGNSGTTAPTHASGAVACSGGTGPFATLTYAGVAATATAIANLFDVTGATTFYIGGTGGNGTYVGAATANTSGGGGGSAGSAANGNNASLTVAGTAVTGGGSGATGNSASNATTGINGTAATTVGGGGAGATGIGSAGIVGGAGFRGQIVITYPIMTPTGSYTAFNTITGTASASQSVAISGTNMLAGITITPPAGFEISTNNSTFSSTLTVGSSGTISIPNLYLRLAAATGVGVYGGSGNNLVLTSTNAATVNISIPTSNVTAVPVPTIVSGVSSLSQFANTNAGSNSASASFTVSGINLTANIALSASANFQISSDNISFSSGLTLTQSGGTVSATTIWARYSPTGNGAYTGNISLTSTGASSQNVSVSGYIGTFYYKGSGAVETTSNWSALSNGTGTSAPVDFTTAGILYNVRASGATTGAWTIAGTGSKVILGDPSVAAITLTIGSAGAITTTSPAVMDIAAASSGSNTLVVQSTTLPTFGTVNAASTIEFQANTTISSPPAGGFGNLTVSAGGPVYSATAMTINGNLTVSGTGTFFTENSTARTISVAGNLSLSGTGGISNTPALTQSTTYTFTGVGKTITNTATGNLFSKSNLVIGSGASYTLASDFNFATGSANRTISGAGSLNIGNYTLNMGTSALTATAVTCNATGKITTSSTIIPAIPSGVTWPCTVQYAASGSQTIVGGTYRHLTLSPTSSSNVDSLASGATVNITDTLELNGSKALKTSLSGGSVVYSAGATLYANLSGSATMSVNPPEWGATNGPTNVTVVANTLLFTPLPFGIGNIGIIRSLPGTLNLSAGSFTINDSNRLVMGNGSNIIRNGGQLSSSGGTIIYGSSATDRVNVLIKATCTNSTEITSTQNNPGAVGTLTIDPSVTYTFTGGRTITDLVNNGIVALSTASSLTFTILGNITGPGTISGNTNASILYAGGNSTLNFTPGFEVAKSLTDSSSGTLTLGNTISISGNLSLKLGTLALGNNDLTVNGTLTGTTGISTAGSGKIIMTGNIASTQLGNVTVDNLELNNTLGFTVSGTSAVTTVNKNLNLVAGVVSTGVNKVVLGTSATLTNENATNYILENVEATRTVGASSTQAFGNIGLTINAGTAPGVTTVLRNTGTSNAIGCSNSSVKRTFTITNSGSSLNATLAYTFVPANELNGLTQSDLSLYDVVGNSPFVNSTISGNTITNTGMSSIAGTYSASVASPGISLSATANAVCFSAGVQNANLTYSAATGDITTYSITWSGAAPGQGFADVSNASIVASPIILSIPAGAAANTYNGSLTVTNSTGCSSVSSPFTITVNPTPILSSSLTAPTCSGTPFTYTATGAVSGSSFNWTRAGVTGINNAASSNNATASISETLVNTTANPIDVDYAFTITANGCSNVQNLTVTVNPTPTLSSTASPADVCSGTAFNYTATSATTGTTYSWTRATVTGISNAAGSGSNGSISETLINTTVAPVIVIYAITLSANGCSNTQNVTVTINPTPTLTSTLTPTGICSGSTFTYSATSGTFNATFSWTRVVVGGISNSAGSGTNGGISEILTNTTSAPISVVYVFTLSANGCSNQQTVTVVVNPTPALSSTLTPAAVCSGTPFSYTATSAVSGATFSWTRATVSFISNAAGSGNSASISETLNNVGTTPRTVTYVFTTSANGCSKVENVVVTVNPSPTLSSTTSPADICSGTVFNYTTTSATTGTTYSWTRAVVTGITNAAGSGSGASINETLTNTSAAPVDVIYAVTLTANGCSNTQSVTVTVNPSPTLTSTLTPTGICSGGTFTYTATSGTTGVTFSWTRAVVAGISNSAGSGSNSSISETLVNTTSSAINVVYVVSLSANGCSNSQNVTVSVTPGQLLSSS